MPQTQSPHQPEPAPPPACPAFVPRQRKEHIACRFSLFRGSFAGSCGPDGVADRQLAEPDA